MPRAPYNEDPDAAAPPLDAPPSPNLVTPSQDPTPPSPPAPSWDDFSDADRYKRLRSGAYGEPYGAPERSRTPAVLVEGPFSHAHCRKHQPHPRRPSSLRRPSRHVVSIYFHEGGDSNKVLAASCKHVFHADTKNDYKLGGAGDRRQQVRVNGMRKFQRALASITYKVDANVTDVVSITEDIERLEKEPKSEDGEMAADKEEALGKKRAQLSELTNVGNRLRDFYKKVTRNWTDITRRNVGYLDWAPAISIDVDSSSYIRDMGAFFLCADKFLKTFAGNLVDLSTFFSVLSLVFLSTFRHELNTIFGGKFPSDMKLRLRGTVQRQDLSNPIGVDDFGNARTIVGKDGSITELTWGNLVGVEAYLCDEFGRESQELAIYNGSKMDRTNFSAKGDSCTRLERQGFGSSIPTPFSGERSGTSTSEHQTPPSSPPSLSPYPHCLSSLVFFICSFVVGPGACFGMLARCKRRLVNPHAFHARSFDSGLDSFSLSLSVLLFNRLVVDDDGLSGLVNRCLGIGSSTFRLAAVGLGVYLSSLKLSVI
ncbi:unnamed protein product [Rhizoctonia solani]|uniref:Uncharacterized protein n=1 Tax=Rhizoctonia solani TaxID=456999 RepID=A0A8H3H8R4_9AGAM|nr:unnamed protein product [Rhizoctonia solani]